jgi:hypothetical protein
MLGFISFSPTYDCQGLNEMKGGHVFSAHAVKVDQVKD